MSSESWYYPMADMDKKHGTQVDWINLQYTNEKLGQVIGRIKASEATPEDWLYLQTLFPTTLYPKMLEYVCKRNAGIE